MSYRRRGARDPARSRLRLGSGLGLRLGLGLGPRLDLSGAVPRLEAALVAATAREPQRAAPVPLVITPVALVLVAAGQARDAAPRAHAARKLAVVPLAAGADVAATAVRPQRVVELAVVLGAVCPAVDAVRQLVVGPLALDLVGLGGGGRVRGMGYGVWGMGLE